MKAKKGSNLKSKASKTSKSATKKPAFGSKKKSK